MLSARSAALTGLAAAYAAARWRSATWADPAEVRRKIAVATWRPAKEGRIMARVVVDADPLLDYVEQRRAAGLSGLTVLHVVGAAAARAVSAVPEANSRVFGGRLVPFPDVSVGFAVDVGNGRDLAPLKVSQADRLTPAGIATELRRGVRALRQGDHPGWQVSTRIAAAVPAPLMRPLLGVSSLVLGGLGLPLLGQPGHPLGTVFISNVGSFGLDEVFMAPVPFARAHLYLALGSVSERPAVRNGQVVAVRQLTLSLTGDHRIVDGAQAAAYIDRLRSLLAEPDVLDVPPDPLPSGR